MAILLKLTSAGGACGLMIRRRRKRIPDFLGIFSDNKSRAEMRWELGTKARWCHIIRFLIRRGAAVAVGALLMRQHKRNFLSSTR